MAKPYNIVITNGVGSAHIANGEYSVTSTTVGYQDSSINPNTLNIVEGIDEYELTIEANGTLTLHVTETGEISGDSIVGAKFIRCDSSGNTYGNEITTDENGNALFTKVPYDSTNPPTIYYKQTISDDAHIFDDTLKSITLESNAKTLEVSNPKPALRNIKLIDANYNGLPISSGSISLN